MNRYGEPDDHDLLRNAEYDFYNDSDETMVDLGGGMVVPLRELLEDES